MKRKIKKRGPRFDKDGYEEDFDGVDIKDLVPVKDPFPPPEEIAKMLRNAKVTILIDQPIVEFFKAEAAKNNTSYQKMIREVLRSYMLRHRRAA